MRTICFFLKKSSLRSQLTPVKFAVIKKINDSKWEMWLERSPRTCDRSIDWYSAVEINMECSQFFLKRKLPYDLAIPFPSIHPKIHLLLPRHLHIHPLLLYSQQQGRRTSLYVHQLKNG